jgi:plastocyanin
MSVSVKRLRQVLAAAVLVPALAGACSAAAQEATSTTTTAKAAAHDMSDMSMPTSGSGKVECAQHMPGDLLTADEAMVIFDAEHVCLGYVTVVVGTAVTWHNSDDVERRVIVEDGNGTALMTFDIAPKGTAQRALKVAGVYHFRTSAIETFVGTIEVQKA